MFGNLINSQRIKKLSDWSFALQSKIEKLVWKVLHHALYSLDIGLPDYHIFMITENSLQEMQFDNMQEVKIWVGHYFQTQPEEFFSDDIKNQRGR